MVKVNWGATFNPLPPSCRLLPPTPRLPFADMLCNTSRIWFNLEVDIFRSTWWTPVIEKKCPVIQQTLQTALHMQTKGSMGSTWARYGKSALELKRRVVSAGLKVILSHMIQQQREQQHNSAIPPPHHPWGRFAHFGAKISGTFQNTRQMKNTSPVYHMQSWKQKWMREGKNKNRKRPFGGLQIPTVKSIHPVLGWIYPPLDRLREPTLRPLCMMSTVGGGKISHFKCF